MKIALIDPSLFTWPYDDALAQGLMENGHEVRIYGKHLARHEPGKHAPHYREFFYPCLQHRIFKALWKPCFLGLKGLMHPFCLLLLWQELRRWRPDIIHFQWTPLPVVDRFFISFFGRIAPVVLTVHDSTPFNDNPGSHLQTWGTVAIMRYFDFLIVHTQQAKERLTAYGINTSRIALIPHGILKKVTSSQSPTDTQEQKITFLLFGKLKPYKGADILIRAFAAMPEQVRARCRLHIVGKAYMDVKPLYALAKELGVEDGITWDLRFVSDKEMADIFVRASAIVMPYRTIDASGVLMAALGMGLPIIASRIGLFAEIVENGRHGYLVEPGDIEGLARALAALAQDKDVRLAMGKEVRSLQAAIPGWRAIAQMTEALYREVITK